MQRWFDFGAKARIDPVERGDGVPFTRLTLAAPATDATLHQAGKAGWVIHENLREFDHYGRVTSLRGFMGMLRPFFSAEQLIEALTDEPKVSPLELYSGDLAPVHRPDNGAAPELGTHHPRAVLAVVWSGWDEPVLGHYVENARQRTLARWAVAEAFPEELVPEISWLIDAAAAMDARAGGSYATTIDDLRDKIGTASAQCAAALAAVYRAGGGGSTRERLDLALQTEGAIERLVSSFEEISGEVAEIADNIRGWLAMGDLPRGPSIGDLQARRRDVIARLKEALPFPGVDMEPTITLYAVAAQIEAHANMAWPHAGALEAAWRDELMAALTILDDAAGRSADGWLRPQIRELETVVLAWRERLEFDDALALARTIRVSGEQINSHFSHALLATWMGKIGEELVAVERSETAMDRACAARIAYKLDWAGRFLAGGSRDSAPEAMRSALAHVGSLKPLAAAGTKISPAMVRAAAEKLEVIASVIRSEAFLCRDLPLRGAEHSASAQNWREDLGPDDHHRPAAARRPSPPAEAQERADAQLQQSLSRMSEDRRRSIEERVATARAALGFGKPQAQGAAIAPFGGGALPMWSKLLPLVGVELGTAGVAQGFAYLKEGKGRFADFEQLLIASAEGAKPVEVLADAIEPCFLEEVRDLLAREALLGDTVADHGLCRMHLAQEAMGLPVTALDGFQPTRAASREILHFVGLAPAERGYSTVKILGPQMAEPTVLEARHRLATTLSFMQQHLGFAYEGGLGDMMARKPFDVCLIRDISVRGDAAGMMQASAAAVLVRLSPMRHEAGVHELAHALDFTRLEQRSKLYDLMHDTGVIGSATEVFDRTGREIFGGGPALDRQRAYFLAPAEILARTVCEGMKAGIEQSDPLGKAAGGAFGLPVGFDFQPARGIAVQFVKELAAEFGNERSMNMDFTTARAPAFGA